jgi:hypothetical protein
MIAVIKNGSARRRHESYLRRKWMGRRLGLSRMGRLGYLLASKD